MTRVHLDEEPVVRKKKDPFTREGQKWSWDFALLVPVRDEDALRETKKRPTSLLRGDVDRLLGVLRDPAGDRHVR